MPAAILVMQDIAATLIPMWDAAIVSGTVDIPTQSAPRILKAIIYPEARLCKSYVAENEKGEQEMKDFVKAAPEDPKAMYEFIHNIADGMQDQDLRNISQKKIYERSVSI